MTTKLPLKLNYVKTEYFSAKSNNFKEELKNNQQLKICLVKTFLSIFYLLFLTRYCVLIALFALTYSFYAAAREGKITTTKQTKDLTCYFLGRSVSM
jgi:hypothetical protein